MYLLDSFCKNKDLFLIYGCFATVPVEPRSVYWIPWIRVTEGCKPPYGGWELNLGLLEEQPVHLTPLLYVTEYMNTWVRKACEFRRGFPLGFLGAANTVRHCLYFSLLSLSLPKLEPHLVISGAVRRRRATWWTYSCTRGDQDYFWEHPGYLWCAYEDKGEHTLKIDGVLFGGCVYLL